MLHQIVSLVLINEKNKVKATDAIQRNKKDYKCSSEFISANAGMNPSRVSR